MIFGPLSARNHSSNFDDKLNFAIISLRNCSRTGQKSTSESKVLVLSLESTLRLPKHVVQVHHRKNYALLMPIPSWAQVQQSSLLTHAKIHPEIRTEVLSKPQKVKITHRFHTSNRSSSFIPRNLDQRVGVIIGEAGPMYGLYQAIICSCLLIEVSHTRTRANVLF